MSKSRLSIHLAIRLFCLAIIFLASACEEQVNEEPNISDILFSPKDIGVGSEVVLTAIATDPDGDPLTFIWDASDGSFTNGADGMSVKWIAPNETGAISITLVVSDASNTVSKDKDIQVVILTGDITGFVYEETPHSSVNTNSLISENNPIGNTASQDQAPGLNKILSLPIDSVTVSVGDIVTTSDDIGYWTLEGIPVGKRVIKAEKGKYVDYRDSVIVIDGTSNYDIYMTSIDDPPQPIQTSSVEGYVYYSGTSIPLTGVLVSIGEISYTTRDDGFFKLDKVQTGQKTMTAKKMEFDDYSQTILLSTQPLAHSFRMTSTTRTAYLHGTVMNMSSEPINDAKVMILNPDSSESDLWSTTDDNGNYSLPTIIQGSINLRFTSNSYVSETRSIFLFNHDIKYDIKLQSIVLGPPNNFIATALPAAGKIMLEWEPPLTSVIGYNLYRAPFRDNTYFKINSSIILSDSKNFVDFAPEYYKYYYYKISTVNIDGIEGPLSIIKQVRSSKLWIIEAGFVDGIDKFGIPAFADLDGDGDFDLLMGIDSTIIAYENIGTISSPKWRRNTNYVSGIGIFSYSFPIPTFGDLDGDSDADLLVGLGDGSVVGYENIGTPSAPQWAENANFTNGITSVESGRASPTLYDIDLDGDSDLIVGGYWQSSNSNNNIDLYKNVGTRTTHAWVPWSLVSEVTNNGSILSTKAALADLDGDGDTDLVLAGENNFEAFNNVGSVARPDWRQFGNGMRTGVATIGGRVYPALADLDGDGDADILLIDYKSSARVHRNQTIPN